MVLKHFLETNPGQLLETIRKWPKPRANDTLPKDKVIWACISYMLVNLYILILLTDYSAWIYWNYISVWSTLRSRGMDQSTWGYNLLFKSVRFINLLFYPTSQSVVRRRRLVESDADHLSMDTSYLMESLAELYTATEQYEHALRIYLSQVIALKSI